MDAVDVMVLRALHGWRRDGHAALLATVVHTWGSSPRPVGSLLALRAGSEMVGSVSGGCIEDDLFERFASLPQVWSTTLVQYGVSAQEAHRFSLPCGGTIELHIEFNPCPQQLGQLLAKIDDGQLVRRQLDGASGAIRLETVAKHQALNFDGQSLAMSLGPRWRMLLIGAGAMAKYLATMAQFNGFAVSVCDPRSEHSLSWDEASVPLIREMPDDAVVDFRPDANSCVVALSHDPKLDDLALLEALNSPAFYVGAIGSRKNSEARRQRLMTHFAVSALAMDRLHGPMGLYIDSKTPAEIAVSVMAEIIAVKNGVSLSPEVRVQAGKLQQENRLQPA